MSNFRNRSVDVHQFSMVPRAEIPRSSFSMQKAHKTTFDGGLLIPVFLEEVLPGDTWNTRMTAFARLATPIFPLMDNLHLDSFFFFVPCRLVWDNWVRFMGEQDNPGDSTSYVIPQMTIGGGGLPVNSIFDYMGLGITGQMGANAVSYNALPMRAYNLIWNQWFRDENLQNSVTVRKGDSGDVQADYALKRRGKRKDYFTAALPWPQKGGTSVSIPLGTSAPVVTGANQVSGARTNLEWKHAGDGSGAGNLAVFGTSAGGAFREGTATGWTPGLNGLYPSNLYADLTAATAATINQLRQSFQIQKLLERDARGGTRYTELLTAHFGVRSPDARLQRPEYLGGGSAPLVLNPVAQSSGTGLTGGTTPLGTLSAIGTAVAHRHGFSQSFVEHGYIIGLVSVRADLSYQQGLRRLWSRSTKHDFYWPAFANLGEQAVLSKEIYFDGSANDNDVFGYQERWAEYRYSPSQISGLFRSTSAGTIDGWHLAQRFASRPLLNDSFIQDTPPLSRVLAVGGAANGAQIIFDSFFDSQVARPMPMYSVPGLIDHF